MRVIAVLASLLTLSAAACASTPESSIPPDYSPVATAPAANARYYADCIAQAAAQGRYGHAHDEIDVVIFTCEGDTAQAFFNALGPWSVRAQSEVTVADRTIRSTNRVQRDLFAVDYCERDSAGYRCAISLRTGEFAQP